ncbi:hypothetical protein EDB84DRAFT_1447560 [Lactarius hengduanensis]|nr:hypothetical protein EDB84DRAFT_1447560 [Lactarius hengduanensis]
MTRAEVTFNCMKVFMLEHGQAQGAPSASGENREEVFRDETVGELMKAFLLPCTLGASPNGLSASAASDEQDDLELAREPFYTDLVALYDAVSFGHPLFAALLLPPLAQRYAPDYRKLVYDENRTRARYRAHPCRTRHRRGRRPPSSGPPNRRRRSWVRNSVCSWAAAHAYRSRASCTGWRSTTSRRIYGQTSAKTRRVLLQMNADASLLEALVIQGEHTVVREVTLYWQRRKGTVALPPVCFVLDPIGQRNRLDWVKSWARGDFVERIEGLLNAV